MKLHHLPKYFYDYINYFYLKSFKKSNEQYIGIPFLKKEMNSTQIYQQKVDKKIYCFWTGDNELTPNRKRCISDMQNNCGVEIVLVTKNNLHNYILPEHPLHPAYEYLSLVHKSDYLRCYFMHYYGGGYSDIKTHHHDWNPAFELLNQSQNKIAIGYDEKNSGDIGYIKCYANMVSAQIINKKLKQNYKKVIGNGSYVFKPYSCFTKLWMQEQHRRLDIEFKNLKKNPGNILGNNKNYPLPWSSILGQIFHPLCLIYQDDLLVDNNIRPVCENYR